MPSLQSRADIDRLIEGETEKALLELHVPRAANVARITDGLVVKKLTEGEPRIRGPDLIAHS